MTEGNERPSMYSENSKINISPAKYIKFKNDQSEQVINKVALPPKSK